MVEQAGKSDPDQSGDDDASEENQATGREKAHLLDELATRPSTTGSLPFSHGEISTACQYRDAPRRTAERR